MSKQPNQTTLIQALSFICKAQKEKGNELETHCQIRNNKILATNGIISVGCSIEEDLCCNPHTVTFLTALQHCGQKLSITQHPGKLSIKSGKFNAFVLCLDDAETLIAPDAKQVDLGEDLRVSLKQVSHLAIETSPKAFLASVLLSSGSAIATNGFTILEYWHGINLPTLSLPKIFVSALCSIDKKLVGFGCTEKLFENKYIPVSATFWFEDESWIKTQLYAEQWPETNKLLECNENPKTIPEGFFEVVEKVKNFSEGKDKEKNVFIDETGLRSHKNKDQGAFFEFEGMPESAFRIEQLKNIKDCAKLFVFKADKLFIFGDKIRGAVMGVRG